MIDEKDELSSQIKQIGIGIIGFAAILFTFLTFMVGIVHPNPFVLLCLTMFTSLLVCIGFFFLFLGSSHVEVGNYLIFMGLWLIVFGILFMILLNISLIVLLQHYLWLFFLFGFPLGYLSGPICILFGIYKKKKKVQNQTLTLPVLGLVIYSISIISIIVFF